MSDQPVRKRELKPRVMASVQALVILFYVLALGGNTGVLAMQGACLAIVASIITLLILEPGAAYWKMAWPGLVALCVLIVVASAPAYIGDSSTFLAPDLYGFGMAGIFAATAMFLAASWIGYRRSGLRYCVMALVAAGLFDIIVGLVLREIDPFSVWGLPKGINAYRFTGTLLNANASACFFGVTAVLSLGILQDCLNFTSRRGFRRYLPPIMIAAALIAIGGCAITGSRTALFLTLGAALVIVFTDRVTRQIVLRPQGLLIIGGVSAMLIAILLLVGNATFVRLSLLGPDLAERLAIWTRYGALALDAPLFGYGPASFGELSTLSMRSPAQARLLWYVNSPHNIVLSLILEHGLAYLAALGITAVLLWLPVRRRRKVQSNNQVARSALASCVIILCCAMVDIALDVPALKMMLVLLAGLLWGQALREKGTRP